MNYLLSTVDRALVNYLLPVVVDRTLKNYLLSAVDMAFMNYLLSSVDGGGKLPAIISR